jgi:GT2 family glycosyltransferase
MPKISLVVLNWNGKQHLEPCFNSINEQTYKDFETLLVDNGSNDGSVELVKEKFPWVKIISLPKNIGFPCGNNEGIKRTNGEYVLTLNNDTKLDKDTLKNLMEVAEKNPKVGMFSLKMVFFYEPNLINSTGTLVYKDGSAINRGMKKEDEGQFEQVEEILGPCAGAALYKKEMLEDIKHGEDEYFDKHFWIYLEDTDLSLRAQLNGWKAMYVPNSIIHHVHSATMIAKSPMKLYLSERNRIWYTIKAFPLPLLLKTPYHTVKRYLKIAKNLKKSTEGKNSYKKSEFIKALIKAWAVGLIFIPRAIKKRRIVQKNKKITNKEFYNLIEKHSATTEDIINS